MRFKVLATFTANGTAFVVARGNGDKDFAVTSSSRLDGVALQERLEIPRKLLRPEHGLDTNVFVFVLAEPADLSRFRKYDVVELIS